MKKGYLLETASTAYRVVEQIGGGGAGTVYKVVDDSDKLWAVKVLDPARATTTNRKRFKNEMAFAQRAEHPNIVRLVDHGLALVGDQRTPFYVMACYTESLKKLISRGTPVKYALRLFAQVLDGVEAAHLLGAIHRDLKPANILHDAATSSLHVADFGIARFSEDLLATLVETDGAEKLANFEYAAPEQRRPGGTVDHRADIFALGLILYEMVMGEVPHSVGAPPIASSHPELAYLDPIVDSMRSQSPAARPQSIAEVKVRLQIAGDVYVAHQKVSSSAQVVIPASNVDDPLVVDPLRIEKVTYDEQGRLLFVFQKSATPQWFAVFQNINWHNAVGGTTPPTFRFHTNAISVAVHSENQVKAVIEQVRRWIPIANDDYRKMLEREQKQRDDEMRNALKVQREREEHRLRMLRAIESAG